MNHYLLIGLKMGSTLLLRCCRFGNATRHRSRWTRWIPDKTKCSAQFGNSDNKVDPMFKPIRSWCSWFFPWLQGHQESGAAILPLIFSELCEITGLVQESQIRWRDRVPRMNRVFDLSLGAFEALTIGNPKVCSTKRLGTTWAGSRRDIDPSLSKVCTIPKSWENIRCAMNIN